MFLKLIYFLNLFTVVLGIYKKSVLEEYIFYWLGGYIDWGSYIGLMMDEYGMFLMNFNRWLVYIFFGILVLIKFFGE